MKASTWQVYLCQGSAHRINPQHSHLHNDSSNQMTEIAWGSFSLEFHNKQQNLVCDFVHKYLQSTPTSRTLQGITKIFMIILFIWSIYHLPNRFILVNQWAFKPNVCTCINIQVKPREPTLHKQWIKLTILLFIWISRHSLWELTAF